MSTPVISNNRRIAKNTVYLYIRMLVTLIVSLYTSRVVLKNLGVEDFGIYNVIGGVVILFVFLQNALQSSSQRFISYELGLGEKGDTNRVFNMSIQCLLFISIIVLFLAETLGLWFVNTQLVIPNDRTIAAEWIYQITILTFIVSLFQVPYRAYIIAHERMSFYAYLGIIDVLLKLGIAFALSISPIDKLILYASLLLLVNALNIFITIIYCNSCLRIGRFKKVRDKILFKQIMGFSGWSMVSGGTVITAQQGGNILLNIFSGVAANGAYGIANQVSSAIYSFVSNFQYAFQPQIVKQYASKDYTNLYLLMNRAAVFSYYLLLVIAIPFCVSADYILYLWLGQVPDYASGFIMLMLLYFLIDALEAPLWMLIGATGKMKVYTLWSGVITIMNVPIAWLLLKEGYSVYWVFAVRAGLNILCGIIRPWYVRSLVNNFSLRQYMSALVKPISVTIIIAIVAIMYYKMSIVIAPLYRIIVALVSTILLIWFVGTKKQEKQWLLSIVFSKTKYNKKFNS